MSIKMLVKNGDIYPTVFCDICDKPIEVVGGGMFAWRCTNYNEGTINEAVFMHKGECDDINNMRTGTVDHDWMWRELKDLQHHLWVNTDLNDEEEMEAE